MNERINPPSRRRFTWLIASPLLLLPVAYFGIGGIAAYELTVLKRNFDPGKNPGTVNLAYQDVRFPARVDNIPIAGWYIPREGSRQALVIVHGKGGSRTSEFGGHAIDLAREMHERGLAVLMIDLRGHGQSGEGHLSFGVFEQRDVLGAVSWLESRGFQPGSIGVLGVSLGAATSMEAAAVEPAIGALVEDSGYTDIHPIIRAQWASNSHLPDFMLSPTMTMGRLLLGYDISSARPVDVVGRIAPRALMIIHGTKDAIIPVGDAQQLKAAAPSAELWLVPGAEHAGAYRLDPAAYVDRVAAFLQKNLKSPPDSHTARQEASPAVP